MKSSIRVALAVALSLSIVACARSSNVRTESAGAGAPTSGAVLVAAGTTFYGKLQQEISSKTSHDGDKFTLVEADTLFHKTPALHGAVINGHLENVQPAGLARKPSMTIVFDNMVMPDGTTAPVNVQLMNLHAFDAKSHHLRTIGLMIGGAIAGHAVARHTGRRHGGMLGAAGGYVLSQELKSDVDVKPGTVLELRFLSNATNQAS